MRRNRAIVDDPATLGLLCAHPGKGRPGAQKGSGQIDPHHIQPYPDIGLIDRAGRAADPGIVEQRVKPAPFSSGCGKGALDRFCLAHITWQDQRALISICCFCKRFLPPPDQANLPASFQKGGGGGASDAATGTRDDDCPVHAALVSSVTTPIIGKSRLPVHQSGAGHAAEAGFFAFLPPAHIVKPAIPLSSQTAISHTAIKSYRC
jgi:hypothetical protein